MPKQHELLAVQSNINGQATKLRTELIATFEKKRHLFEETLKTFTSSDEGSTAQVEEAKSIQTGVEKELRWISGKLVQQVDIGFQVDLANTQAKANVEVDDVIIVKDVPATTLLWLEKRIMEWKEMITAIPTLDPAKGFVLDDSKGKGIFKAREVRKVRTRKAKKVITLAPPTDKHPAQVQLIDVDEPIGTIQEQEWSSMLTPATKADLLDRCEVLYRAVVKARSKANEQEVTKTKIGSDLLDFILEPLKQNPRSANDAA